jgi:hypothetical protein
VSSQKRNLGDVAARFVREAHSDEIALDKLADDPDVPDDLIGFHSQQALEHDPRRMSRASRGSQRSSQVAHTMADEQTGELLRLKVPQGYVYAPLGRHATPVLPAITGDSVLVRNFSTAQQRYDDLARARRVLGQS